MKHSESMAKLAPALVRAQGDLKSITKDKVNPHFHSKYVTLDAIIDTVRPVLASHGLAVMQGGFPDMDVNASVFGVETILLHESGEWISTTVEVPLGKKDPQGAGAAITYGRRYGLSSLLALATDEDDDGNSASARPKAAKAKPEGKATPSRASGAIDRLPSWPAPYKFAGVPLKDAPLVELTRLIEWEPKDAEKYAPLKEAIVQEMERRRLEPDNDFSKAHPGLKTPADSLPF